MSSCQYCAGDVAGECVDTARQIDCQHRSVAGGSDNEALIFAARLEATGQEKTALLFPIDHTHTSAQGAELNAQSVVIALEEANSPLVAFLKEKVPLPTTAPAAAK